MSTLHMKVAFFLFLFFDFFFYFEVKLVIGIIMNET